MGRAGLRAAGSATRPYEYTRRFKFLPSAASVLESTLPMELAKLGGATSGYQGHGVTHLQGFWLSLVQ